jgi:hypothetical protein
MALEEEGKYSAERKINVFLKNVTRSFPYCAKTKKFHANLEDFFTTNGE